MKRSFLLIVLSLMLNIKAFSQSQGGLQEYYYLNNNSAAYTIVPILYFQTQKNWYFEGRYNYEAPNTLAVYAGKVFEKKSVVSYSLNPVLGMVAGQFKGGSAGANIKVDYKKYSFSSQSQYTFSLKNKYENFTYSWSELGYNATEFLAAGLCLQHTQLYDDDNKLDKGIFLRLKYKQFALPLYVFQKPDSERYFVFSLNYEWTYKSIFKSRNNKINNNFK